MTDSLLICAPMRIEALAIRRGLRGSAEVRRTGYGTTRAAYRAADTQAQAAYDADVVPAWEAREAAREQAQAAYTAALAQAAH